MFGSSLVNIGTAEVFCSDLCEILSGAGKSKSYLHQNSREIIYEQTNYFLTDISSLTGHRGSVFTDPPQRAVGLQDLQAKKGVLSAKDQEGNVKNLLICYYIKLNKNTSILNIYK